MFPIRFALYLRFKIYERKMEGKVTDIKAWVDLFLLQLNSVFAGRIMFVGLQGSYARGEATATSDIDIVVIFDELRAEDIRTYNEMLDTLPHRELICGFIAGKKEIENWEPADLFQFYHDTTPIIGKLDDLFPAIEESAVDRAIRSGAGNIFHGCVHNMLHEKSEEILRGLYKTASFVVQAIVFKQSGNYTKRLNELLKVVSSEERIILGIYLKYKKGEAVDFDEASQTLFEWAKKRIVE